jgi:sugar lactone lactonase YvrE
MNNRRSFLKKGMLVCGATGVAGLHGCQTSSSSAIIEEEKPVIGHGGFQYRLDKKWGIQNPNQYPVHHCHEMVMDRNGRLIMTTTDVRNNILIYNKDGDVIDSWTGGWPSTHGLTLKDEGGTEYLYITDPEGKFEVCKTTLDGNKLLTITYPEEAGIYDAQDQFRPTETAIAENGDIYVADGYGKSYIIVYDSNGKYKFHFGGKGDGDDQFDCPHGITIDTRGGKAPELLITSRSKNEFKRFTMEGKHIETIRMPGYFMCRPVLQGDELYFAILATESWWYYDGMVAVLDLNNQVVSLPGSAYLPEYAEGSISKPKYDGDSFLNPHDVCVDNDGNIYVPQWYSGKSYPYRLERV